MFKRSNSVSKQEIYSGKPNNILCLGYKVQKGDRNSLIGCKLGSLGLPMINSYPNSHVNTLKSQLWDRLLCVIGEEAMFALLLKTSIFIPLAGGKDRQTYYQLCGELYFSFCNWHTTNFSAFFFHLQDGWKSALLTLTVTQFSDAPSWNLIPQRSLLEWSRDNAYDGSGVLTFCVECDNQ
jgi:hypothetical protein